METAQELIDYCLENGVKISISGNVLKLTKNFEVGSNSEYTKAESICSVIYDLPRPRSGRVWGTTGDGVGGCVAIKNGVMVINSSDVSLRFLKSLAKIMMTQNL